MPAPMTCWSATSFEPVNCMFGFFPNTLSTHRSRKMAKVSIMEIDINKSPLVSSGAGESRPLSDPGIKADIDEKIDSFNEDSFPASDAPNWASLRHFAKTLKKKFIKEQKETAG